MKLSSNCAVGPRSWAVVSARRRTSTGPRRVCVSWITASRDMRLRGSARSALVAETNYPSRAAIYNISKALKALGFSGSGRDGERVSRPWDGRSRGLLRNDLALLTYLLVPRRTLREAPEERRSPGRSTRATHGIDVPRPPQRHPRALSLRARTRAGNACESRGRLKSSPLLTQLYVVERSR